MIQQRTPSIVIREKLEELLSKETPDSPARQDIYDKVRHLFSKRYPEHLPVLEDVIRDIEARYVQPQKKPRARRLMLLTAAVVIALGAVGGVAAWWLAGAINPEEVATVRLRDYSASGTPLLPLAAEGNRYSEVLIGSDRVIEIAGGGGLFSIVPTEIDPDATYVLSARIRVIEDDPEVGGARTYVGVATYDANDQLQTEPAPGSHRYAAAANRLISAAEGWVDIRGEIAGIGNDNHNQFRPGTRYVRPMVLLNYRSDVAKSQIMSLKLTKK